MSLIRQTDFLIAGQGLAGSLLSWFLLQRGFTCIVVDPEIESTSSRVAAGLIHPIAGRRLLKSWRAETFIPFAHQTYKSLEQKLCLQFFYDYPVLEVFNSLRNQNDWLTINDDPYCKEYLGKTFSSSQINPIINAPFGGQYLIKGGWLNTIQFLDAYKSSLIENDQFLNDTITSDEIVLIDRKVRWKNIEANTFISCSGYLAKVDKYFGYLPFNPAKGELLTIKSNDIPNDFVINHALKIIPKGDNTFLCGATYSWDALNTIPTELGKEKLKTAINKSINCDYEIIEHKAGVRPSTKDRRPFLGRHPKYSQLALFNGLGTKGVMMGPWLANKMAAYLTNDILLEEEYSIDRFEENYNNTNS